MKCPVCKTECGECQYCTECGFDEIASSFLNLEEAKDWMDKVVLPFRKQYWRSLKPEDRNQLIVEIEATYNPSFEFGPCEYESNRVVSTGDGYYYFFKSERANFKKPSRYYDYTMIEKTGSKGISRNTWTKITTAFWNHYLNFQKSDDDFCMPEYFIHGGTSWSLSVRLKNNLVLSFSGNCGGRSMAEELYRNLPMPSLAAKNMICREIELPDPSGPILPTNYDIW